MTNDILLSRAAVRNTRAATHRGASTARLALALAAVVTAAPAFAQPVDPDAPLLEEFKARVQAYAELHRKLEAELPRLAPDAAFETRFKHEMALASRLRRARSGAKYGDIWSTKVRALIRRLVARVVLGSGGARVRAALTDEEGPPAFPLVVNAPYPEGAALSMMPPQLLAVLPPLPEELEYRFVGKTLILRDGHANLIVDYIQKAIP